MNLRMEPILFSVSCNVKWFLISHKSSTQWPLWEQRRIGGTITFSKIKTQKKLTKKPKAGLLSNVVFLGNISSFF